MEPLSQGDPRRLGPYHVIARLGPGAGEVAAMDSHFIARSAAGDRTVVVAAPSHELMDDIAYRERFRVEAENARLLGGGRPPLWLAPVVEVSGGGATGRPWSAMPFLPMLSLPAVLEANGGPLPVRTVRALGAALAETLAEVHTAGFAHAGITPGTVFLAGDGPRLVGYGAVRAAAPDGAARVGLPGLEDDALPPEQAAGGRPRPLGDVFALGTVLAYAATGRRRPDAEDLPEELRGAVVRCLAQDPADRPTARALLDELMRGVSVPLGGPLPPSGVRAPAGAPSTVVDAGSAGSNGGAAWGAGPGSTALDGSGGISRAVGALGPGWLPGRVIAALSELSSAVLAAEIEVVEEPSPATADVPVGPGTSVDRASPERGATPSAVPEAGSAHEAGTGGASSGKTFAPSLSPSRRRLLLGVAGGTAGVAVGGGATWLATAPGAPAPLTPAQRLAAHRPSRRLAGAPPTPLWRYDVKGVASTYAPLIWRDAVAVLTGKRVVVGIDLRTGERLWTRDGLRPAGQPWVTDGDALVVPGDGLVALEPRTGRVRWRSSDFRQGARSSFSGLLAVAGSTVWFTAAVRGERGDGGRVVVAYDVHERSELWREPLASGLNEGHLLKDALVVMAGGDREGAGAKKAVALSRDRGKELWRRAYPGMTTKGLVTTDARRTLIAALGTTLRGFDAAQDAAFLWSVGSKGTGPEGRPADFGLPLVHGKTAYVADGGFALHAIEAATGEIRWQRVYGFVMKALAAPRTPDTLVSPAGRRVLMAGDAEVDAFDAEDGSLLWRFTDAGADPGPRSESARRKVALTDNRVVIAGSGSVYALPLD
ncbi:MULTISPECIES: PQQ-binding-like beta-propeller repeat protein [Streptomyces]|uniref:outer membrane protein assembly factor BamB family protein n=1 Tax=Streptomyces lycopersici TaxID=2974589 RepID=UPI0021CE6655|nr:PQQ-binding-like beta-propeller repeat protein [Streptomyces sp. NEAU-383]